MRICIDASPLILERASGLKTYTKTLIGELLGLDKKNEYVLFYSFFHNRYNLPIPQWNRNVRNVIVRLPRRLLLNIFWQYSDLPKLETFTGPIDIFHSPSIYIPPLARGKNVLTINDLREIYFPQIYTPNHPDVKLRMRSLKRSDIIIAISENTKNDIVKYLHFPEKRIKTIHYDLNSRFRVIEDKAKIQKVLREYNILTPFILYVGNLEKRKNIPVLLKAFTIFTVKDKQSHQLVIAGGVPEKGLEIDSVLRSLYLEGLVHFIPTLTGEDLVCVYNAAACFVFPSLYEGFGLPPLEAMACGCPVIASNRSSVPEVCGDAAILVDPEDIETMAGAIMKVMENEATREDLVQKGLIRARVFQKGEMARKTLEIYKKVVSA